MRHGRRHLPRARAEHEPLQGGVRDRRALPHPGGGDAGGGRLPRACRVRTSSRRRWCARWPTAPIVLAMANPDPEITYDEAKKARPDVDRGHRPLGLPEPGEQRPGLPVHLPRRARRPRAGDQHRDEARRGRAPWRSSRSSRSPTASRGPTATRTSTSGPTTSSRSRSTRACSCWEATAVAKAAMDTGVAREAHRPRRVPRAAREPAGARARGDARHHPQGAQGARSASSTPRGPPEDPAGRRRGGRGRIARPILLGNEERIRTAAARARRRAGRDDDRGSAGSDRLSDYADDALRPAAAQGGHAARTPRRLVLDPNVFGALMVRLGEADGLVSGVTQHYPDTIRPILQIVQGARRRPARGRRVPPDVPQPDLLPRRRDGQRRARRGGPGRDARSSRPSWRARFGFDAARRDALVLELRERATTRS